MKFSAFVIDIYRRNPKRFTLMLIEIIAVNPIPLFQFFIAFQYPSLISFCLIIIAIFVNHLAINCMTMYNLGTNTLKIIDGCLAKGVAGKTIRLSSILNDRFPFEYSIYSDIEHWLLNLNALLKRKLDEMIYIHYAPGQGLALHILGRNFFLPMFL